MTEYNPELCNERHSNIDKKLDKIVSILEGNGKEGHVTRLDRLEQRWKVVWLAFCPIYAAIIGLGIKLIMIWAK